MPTTQSLREAPFLVGGRPFLLLLAHAMRLMHLQRVLAIALVLGLPVVELANFSRLVKPAAAKAHCPASSATAPASATPDHAASALPLEGRPARSVRPVATARGAASPARRDGTRRGRTTGLHRAWLHGRHQQQPQPHHRHGSHHDP
jgi:hypothetical protein